MNNIQDTEETQDAIAQARLEKDLLDSLDRLEANSDFQKLVTEGYFREEAVRLVHAKSTMTPEFQTSAMQYKIDSDISAIGSFANYLMGLRQIGQKGADTLVMYAEMEDEENED